MPISDGIHDAAQPSQPPLDAASRRRLTFYVLPMVIGPLLILVLAFFIVPSAWFARHSNNMWLVDVGYGTELRDVNCQIVLYGDSAAEVGLNPALIEQKTGLKTCNLAQPEGVVVLNGNMVLHRYFEHNAKPRFLVFLYAPEDFNPLKASKDHGLFEAITYRLRQPEKLSSLALIMQHPENGFKWAYVGMNQALQLLYKTPLPDDVLNVRQRTHGQLLLTDPNLAKCVDSSRIAKPDTAWIDSLRTEFSSSETKVLIDVMPTPDCDPGLPLLQQHFSGVVDNSMGAMPKADYYVGGRHVNATGSEQLSNMLADQILAQSKTGAMGAH